MHARTHARTHTHTHSISHKKLTSTPAGLPAPVVVVCPYSYMEQACTRSHRMSVECYVSVVMLSVSCSRINGNNKLQLYDVSNMKVFVRYKAKSFVLDEDYTVTMKQLLHGYMHEKQSWFN